MTFPGDVGRALGPVPTCQAPSFGGLAERGQHVLLAWKLAGAKEHRKGALAPLPRCYPAVRGLDPYGPVLLQCHQLPGGQVGKLEQDGMARPPKSTSLIPPVSPALPPSAFVPYGPGS